MNTLNHFKGNIIIAGTGVGLGVILKKVFRKEILPVSSTNQMILSFSGIFLSTVAGKIIMMKMANRKKLGFDKVENEGFIGPLPSDTWIPFVADNPDKNLF